MKTFIVVAAGLALLSGALFAERLPEQKSGTVAVMKTLRGEAGGVDPSLLALKRITRPTLPESYDTPEGHFKVHYALTGGDAIDSVGYAHKIGQYLERSWAAYMDTIGYLPPPSDGTAGGDGRYDVYLRNISAYGITWPGPEGPQPWTDWTSYIEIENDFDGVYPNDDPEGPVAGAMKITCAHEFHHAVQYGLCGTSSAWVAELTSISFEERLYPQVNDYVWLIDYLTEDPQYPIDWNSGYHMYGLGLFGQYLDMTYGDDFLFDVWDTMRFTPDWNALVTVSDELDGGLGDLFSDFGVAAFFIGSRDCGFFPDGPAFSDMEVQNTHSSYPTDGSASSNRPYGYGLSYTLFNTFPAEESDLNISFHGAQAADWFVEAVRRVGDSLLVIDVVSGDSAGSAVVPRVDVADYVMMVAVPVGATDSRYDYEYSADIEPTGVRERMLPDAARLTAYPNPFNSVCSFEANGFSGDISIFDVAGRPVRSIPISKNGKALWNGLDDAGNRLPSGTYLARVGDAASAVTLLK